MLKKTTSRPDVLFDVVILLDRIIDGMYAICTY